MILMPSIGGMGYVRNTLLSVGLPYTTQDTATHFSGQFLLMAVILLSKISFQVDLCPQLLVMEE